MAASVSLLVLNTIGIATYFAMHCTDLLKYMLDDPSAPVRTYIDITPTVAWTAAPLLITGLAYTLFVLGKVRTSAVILVVTTLFEGGPIL